MISMHSAMGLACLAGAHLGNSFPHSHLALECSSRVSPPFLTDSGNIKVFVIRQKERRGHT